MTDIQDALDRTIARSTPEARARAAHEAHVAALRAAADAALAYARALEALAPGTLAWWATRGEVEAARAEHGRLLHEAARLRGVRP